MKKEDFLNKLRKNTHVQFDMPAVDVKGIQYEDTLKQFIEMTESVGGHVIEAKEGESLDELVKKAVPLVSGPGACSGSIIERVQYPSGCWISATALASFWNLSTKN